ncbi:MAG: thioredoxin family protein [Spirochaetota bacterium]
MKKTIIWLIVLFFAVTVACKQNKNEASTTQSVVETPQVQTNDNAGAQVTFIEIGSVNCIPCRMMQPVMQKIQETYGKKVHIVFYDVWTDEGRPYASQYGIRVIPTQIFLDAKGKEFFRHEGYFPYEAIVDLLSKHGLR